MNIRPAFVEEMLSAACFAAILGVAGCSCLNGNRGTEPALTTAKTSANAPAAPLAAHEAVGLPGVIESAQPTPAKADTAVSQAGFQPMLDNPELQQKFNNLENRFQQRVNQTQAGVNQSVNDVQAQAQKNINETQAKIANQATQLQNQLNNQARMTQQQAQQRAAQVQSQVQRQVNTGVDQASKTVDQSLDQASGTLNKTTNKVNQAAQKATKSAGKFLDSLLPTTNPAP